MDAPCGGLSQIGYITHLRTYSRQIDPDDESKGLETFEQTLARVVAACNAQLKCGFSDDENAELLSLLLALKGSVAGRFMWQLGTGTVDKLGLLSLQNCAAMVIDNPVKCYAWLFDALMLGVGVGFNIEDSRIADIETVRYVGIEALHKEMPGVYWSNKDHPDGRYYMTHSYGVVDRFGDTYYYDDDVAASPIMLVPDSREGWVHLAQALLRQHFPESVSLAPHERHPVFRFNTILIRGKGQRIKTFGGVSSGHEVLTWGLCKINELFNVKNGERPDSVLLLDVANIFGHIVVSGNVRR